MNPVREHTESADLLAAASLGTLTGVELQRVMDHVRHCPECAQLLGEYQDIVASLAVHLPPQPMAVNRSLRLRTRLLQRARSRPRVVFERWAGWMVAAGLAGVLLMHHAVHRPLDYGWLVAGILTVALVGFIIYARVQRARISALQDEIQGLNRRPPPP